MEGMFLMVIPEVFKDMIDNFYTNFNVAYDMFLTHLDDLAVCMRAFLSGLRDYS